MPSEQDLQAILEDAVWAPSGDNVQPWRFVTSADRLHVINDSTADNSLYNYGQHASLMSIGALLTNMELASLARGYRTSFVFFPLGTTNERIASVSFTPVQAEHSALFGVIRSRSTNRKKYDGRKLEGDQRFFARQSGTSRGIRVRAIEDDRIATVARACSLNEKVVLENRSMHDFLFSHITWSAKEDEERPGFFIDTLELVGPQRIIFSLDAYWALARVLNALGLANLVARDNAKVYATSSAMLALCATNEEPLTYVSAGMVMQRLWLEATLAGLAVQPMVGTCLLSHIPPEAVADGLSDAHSKLLSGGYTALRTAFGSGVDEHVLCILRIGVADPPTGRTRRSKVTYNRE